MNLWFPIAEIIAIAPIEQSGSTSSPVVLEPLQNSAQISGCGLGFSLASSKEADPPLVFWFGYGPEGASVRVSGKNYQLKDISSHQRGKGSKHVFTEIWADSGIEVKLVYRVVASHQEGGSLRGTLILKAGGQSKTYQVVGSNGC